MWHVAHIAVRIVAGIAGALSLYASLFLYEDEQGKVQSQLEEWWIAVSDWQGVALSRHTAFMRKIASLTSNCFDEIFGDRLMSWQALGASTFLSAALYAFLRHVIFRPPDEPAKDAVIAAALSVVLIVFAAFGSDLRSYLIARDATEGLLRIVVMVAGFTVGLALVGTAAHGNAVVAAIVLISFLCDVAFIAATRWALRRCADMKHLASIVAVVLVNMLLSAALVITPLKLRAGKLVVNEVYKETAGQALAAMNSVDAVASLALATLALTLLVHRLFWPVLVRPIYALQGLGIARRRLLFIIIAATLLGYAGVGIPEWLKKVIAL